MDSSGRVAVIVEGGATALAQLHDVLLAILVRAQIHRGRLHRRVTEEEPHVSEVRAGAQQLGRARVPEGVRVAQLVGELGGGAEALEDVGDDLPRAAGGGLADASTAHG